MAASKSPSGLKLRIEFNPIGVLDPTQGSGSSLSDPNASLGPSK